MFFTLYLISFRGDAVLIDLTALCGQTSLTLTFGHVQGTRALRSLPGLNEISSPISQIAHTI